MRRIQEPFTLPKHGNLQEEINDMIIAIKLHHIECVDKNEKPEQWAKAQNRVMCPTWGNVIELLDKSYKALNTERFNPIKY